MTEISLKNQISCFKDYIFKSHLILNDAIFSEFLKILNNFLFFQEEGTRITPKVLIGHRIESKEFKKVFNGSIIHIRESKIENASFYKNIKPLLPFCNNGWIIYINITDSLISFGIIKTHSPINGLTTDDIFNDANNERLYENYGVSYLYIKVYTKTMVLISNSVNSEVMCINYTFGSINESVENDEYDCFKVLAEDVLSQKNNENIRNCFEKIFNSFVDQLHGCILLVVKNEFCLHEDEFLKDGIYLNEPIDLYSIVEDVILTNKDTIAEQKFRDYINVFYNILNFDGITIIDNSAKVLGYNIFIKSDLNQEQFTGGARKRAAMSLLNSKNYNYIGVYFQSQDGERFYRRVKDERCDVI